MTSCASIAQICIVGLMMKITGLAIELTPAAAVCLFGVASVAKKKGRAKDLSLRKGSSFLVRHSTSLES